ncbi:hypothetical protein ACFQZO_09110 [Bradyrhizobium sp. GCM10027634]|uniref:hypothetical protein n=1 Tax=unclassified Bradyrhizobium TaxID=2631580 RepID=UPI00188A8F49|nr:hypothetical protein [Bradyrhizobium sp. WYCCWR 12677]MDN5001036.1 hypothetical protein [Bradyrhizobium sp. WYCCWR 12677]QOZ48915.1 hypothetical protein XH89_25800 [Bradyrhizobium sp. CCBAU 53340]
MYSSIELIVASHVELKNRRALEELRGHRHHLLEQLRMVSGIDPARAIEQVEEDIRVIDEGLEQLRPPPGTLPDNEWR